ncbi:hypothetical protein B0H34DRAFT_862790 [Crassisporium funariophilum]|nr:hypothetical protein B0H34DRAFT_862790 [Crassisporium funariophilum]
MATTPPRLTFKNFEAWVKVDTQAYGIEIDNTKKEVTCWIASEAGKYVDDDAFLSSSSSTSNIGEIKLVIERVRILGSPDESDEDTERSVPKQQKVHERSKKAITHQVGYGEEEIQEYGTPVNTVVVERLVTFIFRYRPLEILQANVIASRNLPAPSPTPEIVAENSPVGTSKTKRIATEVKLESEEGDSDAEAVEAIRVAEALLERLKRARLMKKAAQQKKKVRTETQILLTPGEVIDLT